MKRILYAMRLAAEKLTRTYYLKQYLSSGILNGNEFEKMEVSVFYFLESFKLIGYRIRASYSLSVHRVNFEPIGFLNELAVCSRENPSRPTRSVD
jgi:hypothetical protein